MKKNNYLVKSLREIGILTIALTAALVVNYAYGQVWNDPACGPTGCNAPAPINVSNTAQTKEGNLDIANPSGTAVLSTERSVIMHNSPQLLLQDTTVGDLDSRIVAANDQIHFQHDENDNPLSPNWQNALVLKNNADAVPAAPDYARFFGQVRASEYCDASGNNCSAPPFGGGGGGASNSIFGEVGSTGEYWPDIITCQSPGDFVDNGILLTVAGAIYSDKVVYKFPQVRKNDGNEVAVVFNKTDGSYSHAQGVWSQCTGRSIQNFISAGEAFYYSSGWSGGSLPVGYAWQQEIVTPCTAPAATCAVQSTSGVIEYNVFCADSANPSVSVSPGLCTGAMPADGVHACYDSVSQVSCR